MNVSIVTLVWNNWRLAKHGLASIFSHLGPRDDVSEIIVLDNGSDSDTQSQLDAFATHSKCRLCRSNRNLGCGGGRNIAFSMATGDRILSLDSDSFIQDTSILDIAEQSLQTQGVGIVGPFGGDLKRNQTPGFSTPPHGFEGKVDCVSGYCQYFSTSLLSHLPLFDERLFMGGAEDLDFCLTVRQKTGLSSYLRPLPIYHVDSHTARYDYKGLWQYFVRKWRSEFPKTQFSYPQNVPQGKSRLPSIGSRNTTTLRPPFRHWNADPQTQYQPLLYAALAPQEQTILQQWYDATSVHGDAGEIGIAMASIAIGLISGSNIRRIVQTGHCFGYSTLLIGFCLRHMGAKHGLWSVDINPLCTQVTADWVMRSGLLPYIWLHTACSADPNNPTLAKDLLGGRPEMLIIDSSHQYAHTLRELELWYDELVPGGIVLMHDISRFAEGWDSTNQGGVRRALSEWLLNHDVDCLLLNKDVHDWRQGGTPGYHDVSGLAIFQKLTT